MNLQDWIIQNKLQVETISEKIFEIKDFGKFLLIQSKEDKIIGTDFDFLLDEEEYEILDKGEVKYILFEFGENFYYSELKTGKNQYNETFYKPQFNTFKSIGKAKIEFDLEFTNLGVHSEYELLNGSSEVKEWAKKAKFLGHTKLAICDRNTLGGTLPFQMACEKAGIKSILGETVSVAYDYTDGDENRTTFDLKLYVVNKEGWRNLLKINKAINVDYSGFIPEDELLGFSKGLVCVFSRESYLTDILPDKIKTIKFISKYRKFFDSVFYQIDSVEFESDEVDKRNLENIKLYFQNYRKIIEPVLINDCYYIERTDFEIKQYFNKTAKTTYYTSTDQYYKDIDDIILKLSPLCEKNETAWNTIVKALENSNKIADKCDYKIDTGKHKLPKFDCPDSEELFFELLENGMKKKVIKKGKDADVYYKRIEIECDVIVNAGFCDYFLILWDLVKWAKSQDIIVGPGRGSVGGSLIAYLLDITTVDPIEFDLLFERFLNKTRLSGERAKAADALPDIDIDFESGRRDEVKKYLEFKYGVEYVCSIGTYNRMKLKTALKDFSRVKGISFEVANTATKKIDDQIDYDWGDLVTYSLKEPYLYDFVQRHYDICNLMKPILNQAKTAGIHASAMLILPRTDDEGNPMNIFDWLPVKKVGDLLISEWEGKYVERAGFLKEDILALDQLDKFNHTLKLIRKTVGKKIILEDIDLDDRKTFKHFHKGLNEDVFQFSSAGLKLYSVKVKPDSVEDLTAMNALYRPGPMDSKAHEDFALIKHGKKKVKFDYLLEPVTAKTFGLFIYQEQIMQAVNVLGGLTLAQADELRTAIKKFDHDKMESFEKQFLEGAAERGCDKNEAKKIWNKLNAFSSYGFNRSHAAAYSVISYWSQWLKVNYPLQFWTTSLQFSNEKGEVPNRISEINKSHLEVTIKPPHINKSDKEFQLDLESNSIYWSIMKIKGVGAVAVENILKTRESGEFESLEQFVRRVPKNKVNKGVVVALIIAGCFDELEGLNNELGRIKLLEWYHSTRKEQLPEEYKNKEAVRKYWWILKQRELTGFGTVNYNDLIDKKFNKAYPYLDAMDFMRPNQDWKEVSVAGQLMYHGERNSKNGKFGRLTIDCNNTLIHVVMWSDTYNKYKKNIPELKDKLICISGKIKFDSYRRENVLQTTDDSTLLKL